MADPFARLRKGDALIVVDVQNDFCPGGKLAVPEGDRVIPVLNRWITAAREKQIPVFASRDWHPVGHTSFTDRGGMWPPHCIQDAEGAAYHPALALPPDVIKITKGVRFDQDQNSVFDQTGLSALLEREKIRRIWIGGLALDVCVLASVLDGQKAGLAMMVLRDATRPVNPDGAASALREMEEAGASIVA